MKIGQTFACANLTNNAKGILERVGECVWLSFKTSVRLLCHMITFNPHLKIAVGIEGELANKNVWFLTHRLDEELIMSCPLRYWL